MFRGKRAFPPFLTLLLPLLLRLVVEVVVVELSSTEMVQVPVGVEEEVQAVPMVHRAIPAIPEAQETHPLQIAFLYRRVVIQ